MVGVSCQCRGAVSGSGCCFGIGGSGLEPCHLPGIVEKTLAHSTSEVEPDGDVKMEEPTAGHFNSSFKIQYLL